MAEGGNTGLARGGADGRPPIIYDFFWTIAAVALVLLVVLVLELAKLPHPAGAVIFGIILVCVILWLLGPRVARTQQGLALVYSRLVRTPYGARLVRVLRQGGVYQSATYRGFSCFEPVFAYHRALDAVFAADEDLRAEQGRGVTRVLALGGGGYAWPKHVLTTREDVRMGVVEIDPAVTEIARSWFYLGLLEKLVGRRLQLICADARAYLDERSRNPKRKPLDAIVNDTFVGAEPVRSLATVEAARAVKACLVPGGVYAMNVVSREGGADLTFLRDEVATLRQVFEHVHVLPADDETFGGEENYLLIATDGPTRFHDTIPYDDDFLGRPLIDESDVPLLP